MSKPVNHNFNLLVFFLLFQEQAGEIILTLGEAFEIAYQMALKERKEDGGVGVMGVPLEQQLSQLSDQDDVTSMSSVSTV